MVIVEGVMLDIGDAVVIKTNEDIQNSIAIYLSLGLENVCVNFHITKSHSITDVQENLIPSTIMEENELDGEENLEVEEIVECSDSKFEEINADDDEDDENNWSDYDSDKDQFLYESDFDLQVKNQIAF
ncbi:hypothetical protein Salat_1895000 [Sesamum alatum]|uniref:Uncharacterized protein n=1 Tax=Sesamum alatum TaxID=300844 RepID=A0AAE2CIE4_9LAMI|nr:hypothetical protein Salat_1895000 [Sesamum alatum]